MKGQIIRLFQLNTLADSLADKFAFPETEEEMLYWKPRNEQYKLILELPPSIVVLEEVDHNMLKEFAYTLGKFNVKYEHRWLSKNDTKPRDGTAIFWPQNNFLFHDFWTIGLGTQNALMVKLECRNTGLRFVVCGVHLKAKVGFEKQRASQVEKILLGLKNEEHAFVVGDFNDVPDSLCVKLMAASGFKNVFPRSPPTTSKIHSSGHVIRCIDYIWYKGGSFQLTSAEMQPKELSALESPYLPNAFWPSDHAALQANFKIS